VVTRRFVTAVHRLWGTNMSCKRVIANCSLALSLLTFWVCVVVPTAARQVAEPPEKADPGQHGQHGESEHHHLQLLLGEKQCKPDFTYQEGPHGPRHWPGLCSTGRMQAPIDIQHAAKLPIDDLKFNYQPADLDIINDCNQYRVLVKFPDNYWLTVGKKPYFLSELHFREPGENAINGKRPRMSVQFVHFSPEGVFLIVEVPIVAGKENPAIKAVWERVPAPGKERKVEGTKINPNDLLPADRSFYRFPGSLTTPICNEVVTWYVMRNPIELSEAQIAEYAKRYHNTARPLQPLHERPVSERR
jgi:carbonic anhydrase